MPLCPDHTTIHPSRGLAHRSLPKARPICGLAVETVLRRCYIGRAFGGPGTAAWTGPAERGLGSGRLSRLVAGTDQAVREALEAVAGQVSLKVVAPSANPSGGPDYSAS